MKLPDEEDEQEEEDPIMIRVIKPTPAGSTTRLNNEETPLLNKDKSETKM